MNFFYQVKESVIDSKFYNNIKENSFAKSFLYLLLLMLIIYSMLTVRNYLLFKTVMENTAMVINARMPEFQLKDGKFSFEGEMPYYISSSTNEIFVIDTTGTVDESVLNNARSGLLITEDRMYIKNGLQQQVMRFSEMGDVEFNKQKLIEFLPKISWLVLIFMLIWFVFALIGQLLFAVLLALIGLAINSSLNTDLKFRHLLNFSIYALTLPMILDLAVDISMLPISQALFFAIYTVIALAYLYNAVKAYKESSNQQPHNGEGMI